MREERKYWAGTRLKLNISIYPKILEANPIFSKIYLYNKIWKLSIFLEEVRYGSSIQGFYKYIRTAKMF